MKGVCILDGPVAMSDMRLSQAGELVACCDIVAVASPATSDVVTSSIVAFTVSEVITSYRVIVRVVVFSSDIVGGRFGLSADKPVSQRSTSPHASASHR
jgi:hypothetical protein